MNTNFTIIGGDLRIIKLAQMIANDGNKIYTYGIEKAEGLKQYNNIEKCNELKQAIEKSDVILGPIPFSIDGENINSPFSDKKILIKELISGINKKVFIAGSISKNIYELLEKRDIEVEDIMKVEELAILNTIATAEGTIEIIISNIDKIIHGSKILILGFGRVGKTLAGKLAGLSADITCAARKQEDLAWIRTYGYNETNIKEIGENLGKYDIIINTVPDCILSKEKMEYVRRDSLLIDLASNPGGIDKDSAKDKNLKLIHALALPGKVAPTTTAEFIKKAIYDILKKREEIKNE